MPHMDMTADAGADEDYSSYEYQHQVFRFKLQEQVDAGPVTNVNAAGLADFEPLDQVGGLDNNEVAELVALETYANTEIEDESGDQDVGTTTETRGVVGINLPPTEGSLPGDRNETVNSGDVIDINSGIVEANIEANTTGGTEDQWLQLFQSKGTAPFDDKTSGPGGAGGYDAFHNEKYFRQISGRGPVLDQNDSISVVQRVNVGDTVVEVTGLVRISMIWDVAETSDAGRAFSVPMD